VSFAGKKFGILTIVSSPRPDVYKCLCKCGNVIELWYSQLKNNVVRHCGCKDKPRAKRAKFYRHLRLINRHKYDRRPKKFCSGEYHSYTNMLRRCYGKNRRGEFLCENWGGKGIRVCDRWREAGVGFKNFLADMGPRPLGKSLDRKNPQDHYTPLNCQWGTKSEQVYHQTRYMWKDETPPPIPSIRDTNEQIDDMFGSEPY
jgi:hypothetical protein